MRDTRVRSSFVPKLTRPVARQTFLVDNGRSTFRGVVVCFVVQSETSEERDAWIKAVRATIASMVRCMDVLLLGRCLHLLSLNNNAPSSFSIYRLMGPTILCSAHLLLRRWRRLAARSWQVQQLARRPPQCRQWGRPWERARALPRSVAAPSLLPRHATPRHAKTKNTQNHAVHVVMDGRC